MPMNADRIHRSSFFLSKSPQKGQSGKSENFQTLTALYSSQTLSKNCGSTACMPTKVGSLEFHLHKAITRWPINATRVVSEKQGLLSCQNCNKSLWCQWRPHGELELHVVMKRSSPCHCRCQLKLSGNLDFFLHLTEMKQPNFPLTFLRSFREKRQLKQKVS